MIAESISTINYRSNKICLDVKFQDDQQTSHHIIC